MFYLNNTFYFYINFLRLKYYNIEKLSQTFCIEFQELFLILKNIVQIIIIFSYFEFTKGPKITKKALCSENIDSDMTRPGFNEINQVTNKKNQNSYHS